MLFHNRLWESDMNLAVSKQIQIDIVLGKLLLITGNDEKRFVPNTQFPPLPF